MNDFEKLNLSNINDVPLQGKIGKGPDGSTVVVRYTSKRGEPILEMFDPLNHSHTIIRYTNEETNAGKMDTLAAYYKSFKALLLRILFNY